jgi:hypothetical protein
MALYKMHPEFSRVCRAPSWLVISSYSCIKHVAAGLGASPGQSWRSSAMRLVPHANCLDSKSLRSMDHDPWFRIRAQHEGKLCLMTVKIFRRFRDL